MRLVLGAVLLIGSGRTLSADAQLHVVLASAPLTAAALLLVVGLWTPVAGAIVATIELSQIARLHDAAGAAVLAATIAVALALLGPGRWSVDARLFGWRRIDTSAHAK